MTTTADARAEFAPEVVYLDTPTMGLPPRTALRALRDALTAWAAGRSTAADYDGSVDRSRAAYARLVQVPVERVAIGSQASSLVGIVAASLPAGSTVLAAEGEFTSLTFPFLAQAARGVVVREVPLERLLESIGPDVDLVAVSAVQSRDGRVTDLDALAAACDAAGTRALVDATQAAGWLPIDAGRFAYTVTAGYKWLLGPRGTGYLTVAPGLEADLVPHAANWYAGERPWESIYGTPLRLAHGVRRFDTSPAWHSWVGAAPALELLVDVGAAALHEHAVGLANRFRTGVGLETSGSAIVSVGVDDQAAGRLLAASVRGSVRDGRTRLGFHVSTSADDVDRAVEALAGHVLPA
ncbi:MAG: aminotransferase class V-fold PLP-dependent enzyme [Nocardioides sp.]|nr:aminotransferase class V-fold PLP-dependent enzyme [Nocardioides sp.]